MILLKRILGSEASRAEWQPAQRAQRLAGGCAMYVTRQRRPMLNLHAQERSRCSILEQGGHLRVERIS